jgi:hypothetical protein
MAANSDKGYRTSEFWLSLAAVLLSATLASGLLEESDTRFKVIYAVVTALTALGYTASRAIVKTTADKANALKAAANPSPPPAL